MIGTTLCFTDKEFRSQYFTGKSLEQYLTDNRLQFCRTRRGGGGDVTDSSLELYGKGKKLAIRDFLQSELFAFTVFCREKGFPCLSIMRGDVVG